jgi:hypothetical protein
VLIVSVHDVGAANVDEVRWLLGRLDEAGIRPRVLKVVPSPGGDAVRELAASEWRAGSEIVLHGWTHRMDGRARGSAGDRLRAALFAAGSAEFLALDRAEMARRLAAGGGWLDEAGIPRGGFCPPAWLAVPGLRDALRGSGFSHLVTLRGVEDLLTGRRMTLPPTGYMGAGGAQEGVVRIGAALVARPLGRLLDAPARRVFIHPERASSSRDCARVLREVERLARRHRPVTYRQLLDA